MADAVLYDAGPRAVTLTLNRPQTKNAINLETLEALRGALERASREEAARVVVLQGAGGDLSSGGDIQDMLARRGQGLATYQRLRTGLSALVRALVEHEKPTIARVDGVCMGAGAGLAIACDALLATTRSSFGFPFVKVGLVPDTGTSWTLVRKVGLQHARRLLLTGESIDAGEAHSIGLVTELVTDATALEAETRRWVTRFARLPPTAVRDTKRLLWNGLHLPLNAALEQEALTQGLRFTTPEHAAAVDAFLARRGTKK